MIFNMYRVCITNLLWLLPENELFFSAEDFIDPFPIEDCNLGVELFYFLNKFLGS